MATFASLQDPVTATILQALQARLRQADGMRVRVGVRPVAIAPRHGEMAASLGGGGGGGGAALDEDSVPSHLARVLGLDWHTRATRSCLDDLIRAGGSTLGVRPYDPARPDVQTGELINVTAAGLKTMTMAQVGNSMLYATPVVRCPETRIDYVTMPFAMLYNTTFDAAGAPTGGEVLCAADDDGGGGVSVSPQLCGVTFGMLAGLLEAYEYIGAAAYPQETVDPATGAVSLALAGLLAFSLHHVAPRLARNMSQLVTTSSVPNMLRDFRDECRLLLPDAATPAYSAADKERANKAFTRLMTTAVDEPQRPVMLFMHKLWLVLREFAQCTVAAKHDSSPDACVQQLIGEIVGPLATAAKATIAAALAKLPEASRERMVPLHDEACAAVDTLAAFRARRLPVVYEMLRSTLFSFSGLAYGHTHNFMLGAASDYAGQTARSVDVGMLTRRCYQSDGGPSVARRMLLAWGAVLPAHRTSHADGTPVVPRLVNTHSFDDAGTAVFWPVTYPDKSAAVALSQLYFDMHKMMSGGTLNPGGVAYRRAVALLWTGLHYSMLHTRGLWSHQHAGMPHVPTDAQPRGDGAGLAGAARDLVTRPAEHPFCYMPVQLAGMDPMRFLMAVLDNGVRDLLEHPYLVDVAPQAMHPRVLATDALAASGAVPSVATPGAMAAMDASVPSAPVAAAAPGTMAEQRDLFCRRALTAVYADMPRSLPSPANLWAYMVTPRQVLDFYRDTGGAASAITPLFGLMRERVRVPADSFAPLFAEIVRENFEVVHDGLRSHKSRPGIPLHDAPDGLLTASEVVSAAVINMNKYLAPNPSIHLDVSKTSRGGFRHMCVVVFQTLGLATRLYAGQWPEGHECVKKPAAGAGRPAGKRVATSGSTDSSEAARRDEYDDDDDDATAAPASLPPPAEKKNRKTRPPTPADLAPAAQPDVYRRMRFYRMRSDSPFVAMAHLFSAAPVDEGGMRTNYNHAQVIEITAPTTAVKFTPTRQEWLAAQPLVDAMLPGYAAAVFGDAPPAGVSLPSLAAPAAASSSAAPSAALAAMATYDDESDDVDGMA